MRSNTYKILISSIGSTGALGVLKALREQKKYNVMLLGLDANDYNAGRYLVDKFFKIPLAIQPNKYKDAVLNICHQENIDVFIPIMEKELEILSSILAQFPYKIICPPNDIVQICNNKNLLHQFLTENDFHTPKIYKDKIDFPAILKPVFGGGSKNTYKLEDKRDLAYFTKKMKTDYIIQEFIEGIEYSIDTFTDFRGHFVGAVPRIRIETKGGLATKSKTVYNPKLIEKARNIVGLLNKLNGPINIQAIERDNKYYFTDLNLRFGGASYLSFKAGLNGPLFILNQLNGDPIKYNGYKVNFNMLRYWQEVFIDEKENFL